MRVKFVLDLFAVIWLLTAQTGGVIAAEHQRFEAAYYGHDAIYIFPTGGKAFSIRLPSGVPPTANLIGFDSSGRSAYLQIPSAAVLHQSDELIRVDLSPVGLFSVPGSGGLGDIFSLTNSLSGNLLVAAAYGQGLCGAYEIDALRGTHRPIWTTPARPDCRFGAVRVEPDGKRVLIGDNVGFKVIDPVTGAVALSGINGRGAWSPDGNWFAISTKGGITLFDGKTFSVRRHFVSSVHGYLVWAPDSKRILFPQQQRGCEDDFESLAILDVVSGSEWVISSSHCMITGSQIGWIDAGALSGSPELPK